MASKRILAALRDEPSVIETFYLNAMTEGFVSTTSKPRKVPNLPDSKQVIFQRDGWKLTDTWHVTPASDYSGGATHIYFEDTLVWMMHYFGRYPQSLIPFLKEALAEEFKNKRFTGGRGPKQLIFKNKGLIYRNQAEDPRFIHFHGEETLGPALELENDQNFGWHRYHGGLML